jgi:hypothetical protein
MPERWSHFVGPVVILLAAVVAIAPQLIRGNSCGHDFDFHLVSWLDAQNRWRQGLFYPHWAPSANFGAGEPRFVFYPSLTWMLGAALGFVLPWTLVPVALTFLLLAGTGLATRALARQALDDAPATLAGCAAIFSGYALFTAYERSAFGELSGGFWIPLLLLFALRDRNVDGTVMKRTLDGSTVPMALVIAGAWLSNVPVGIMASYLLAAVALAFAMLAKSWAPVVRAALGAGLGIGLAAIYLVPATWEQRWIDIQQITDDPGLVIENSWLFAHHANPLLASHDMELHRVSLIAVSMLAVALGGLLVSWKRGRLRAAGTWWIPLAFIPFAILFLQFPFSQPLWNLLPKFRFLQFPWRWLVVLEAPTAIFLAAAVWPHKPVRRWPRIAAAAVCAAIFVVASVAEGKNYFQPCDEEDNVAAMVAAHRTGEGFAGTDEYEPPDADDYMVAKGLPDACLVSDPSVVLGRTSEDGVLAWDAAQGTCDATLSASRESWRIRPEDLHILDNAVHAGYLILRRRSYPAWRVTVNGQPVNPLPPRDDGLMAVPVPEGRVDVTVHWMTTPDVVAGRWLSALALLLLAALFWLERKLSRPQLS